jgi:hypothetical protein
VSGKPLNKAAPIILPLNEISNIDMLHTPLQGKCAMAVLRQRQYRVLLVLAGSFFNIFKRLLVLLPVLCIIPLHASAQEILKSLPEDDATQPWQIEADEINYDENFNTLPAAM